MKVAVAAFLFAKRNMKVKHLIDDLQFLIYDLIKKRSSKTVILTLINDI